MKTSFKEIFYEGYFPFKYNGEQEVPNGKSLHLFTALENIKGLIKGSTYTAKTLVKAGIPVPEKFL